MKRLLFLLTWCLAAALLWGGPDLDPYEDDSDLESTERPAADGDDEENEEEATDEEGTVHRSDYRPVPVEGGYPFTPLAPDEEKAAHGWAQYLQALYLTRDKAAAQADPDAVISRLKSAAEIFPDQMSPLMELYRFRADRNEVDKFLEDIRPIVDAHPDLDTLRQLYIGGLLDTKRYPEAKALLDQLVQRQKDPDSTTFSLQAQLYDALGDSNSLKALLKRIAALPPEQQNAELLQLQVQYFLQEKDFKPAATAAERLVAGEQIYADEQALDNFPDQLTELKRWDLLERFLKKYQLVWSDSLNAKGLQAVYLGRTAAALHLAEPAELKKILEEMLASPEVSIHLLMLFGNQLEEYLWDHAEAPEADAELGIAIQVAEALRLRSPGDLELRRHLLVLYRVNSDYVKALAILETIPDRTPADEAVRAELLARLKRYPEALKLYGELDADPQNKGAFKPAFFNEYAIAAEEAGQTDLAIALLKRALAMDPKSPTFANSLGYTLADHNQELPLALQLIRQAVDAEPDNLSYLDSLAWVYYRMKDYPKALQAMADAFQQISDRELPEEVTADIQNHLNAILKAAGYSKLADFYK